MGTAFFTISAAFALGLFAQIGLSAHLIARLAPSAAIQGAAIAAFMLGRFRIVERKGKFRTTHRQGKRCPQRLDDIEKWIFGIGAKKSTSRASHHRDLDC
jgi:hypothetical protein